MRPRSRRGLTLVEALVALLLMSAFVGVLASLFSSAAGTVLFQQDTDDSLRSLKAAESALVAEVRQGVAASLPQAASATTLTFKRIYAPDALSSIDNASAQLPRLAVVTYRWEPDEAVLYRECAGRTLTVARNITRFAVAIYDPGRVDYSVSAVTGAKEPVTVSGTVRALLASPVPATTEIVGSP